MFPKMSTLISGSRSWSLRDTTPPGMARTGGRTSSFGVLKVKLLVVTIVAVRYGTARLVEARRCLPKAFDKKRPPMATTIIVTSNADQRSVTFIRMFSLGLNFYLD